MSLPPNHYPVRAEIFRPTDVGGVSARIGSNREGCSLLYGGNTRSRPKPPINPWSLCENARSLTTCGRSRFGKEETDLSAPRSAAIFSTRLFFCFIVRWLPMVSQSKRYQTPAASRVGFSAPALIRVEANSLRVSPIRTRSFKHYFRICCFSL